MKKRKLDKLVQRTREFPRDPDDMIWFLECELEMQKAINTRLLAQIDEYEAAFEAAEAVVEEPARPQVGDRAILHFEGTVTEVRDHYYTVEADDGSGGWSVEFGEPHWAILPKADYAPEAPHPVQDAPTPAAISGGKVTISVGCKHGNNPDQCLFCSLQTCP